MSETSDRCSACGRIVWIGPGRAAGQPCYECLVEEVSRLRAHIDMVSEFLEELADPNTVPVAKWIREQAVKLAKAAMAAGGDQ